jgi:fructose-1,6-bisphosphatase
MDPDDGTLQVAFDPVDGSSIIPANFAVGSIFGIWPGKELIGRTGREQAAACYAVYGPRTILILSRPFVGEDPAQCFKLVIFLLETE